MSAHSNIQVWHIILHAFWRGFFFVVWFCVFLYGVVEWGGAVWHFYLVEFMHAWVRFTACIRRGEYPEPGIPTIPHGNAHRSGSYTILWNSLNFAEIYCWNVRNSVKTPLRCVMHGFFHLLQATSHKTHPCRWFQFGTPLCVTEEAQCIAHMGRNERQWWIQRIRVIIDAMHMSAKVIFSHVLFGVWLVFDDERLHSTFSGSNCVPLHRWIVRWITDMCACILDDILTTSYGWMKTQNVRRKLSYSVRYRQRKMPGAA